MIDRFGPYFRLRAGHFRNHHQKCGRAHYLDRTRASATATPRPLAARIRNRRTGDCSRVYMGMDEDTITARLRHYRPQAPDPVNGVSAAFAILQEHRGRAMERPGSTYLPSRVAQLMRSAKSAITALATVGAEERRSLAINLLFRRVRAKGATPAQHQAQAAFGLNEGQSHPG